MKNSTAFWPQANRPSKTEFAVSKPPDSTRGTALREPATSMKVVDAGKSYAADDASMSPGLGKSYAADDASMSPGLGEVLHLAGSRIRGVTRPPRRGTCLVCGCVPRMRKSGKTSSFGLRVFGLGCALLTVSMCLSGIAFLSVWYAAAVDHLHTSARKADCTAIPLAPRRARAQRGGRGSGGAHKLTSAHRSQDIPARVRHPLPAPGLSEAERAARRGGRRGVHQGDSPPNVDSRQTGQGRP